MTEKAIQLEAKGEFPFSFYIEKAVATETEKELILEGVASTSNIDHDNERMSREALHAMANVINEKSVPLRVEHSKSDNAIIGKVTEASVDERNQLHIKAVLDKNHPVSSILHNSMMKGGTKMGFSVGGLVKRAVKEFSEAAGKLVKTFYDVELKEVSVTPRPANYDAWAIGKEIAKTEAEVEKSRSTAFYDEFLFANPQLDYLQAFAKSVPDEAWRKVGSPTINKTESMTTETETKEKAETTEETNADKAIVTRSEFGVVVKGIETLTEAFKNLVNKMTDDGARDQNAPTVAKPEDESPTAKAEGEAHDQNAPTKDKPEDESPTAKSETEEDDTKKASDKTDDYDIETVERSISALGDLTKRIQGIKKEADSEETEKDGDDDKDKDETTKDADDKEETTKDSEDKDETTKGVHPLDQFVIAVTKTVEAMVEKMEKSGMNVIGFKKSIVDSIVSDPKIQEDIQAMLKTPGFKKSVSLGVPYMVTKEGKRFALTASEVGAPTIEKSRTAADGKKSFKELYNSEFSSVRAVEE